MAKIGIVIDIIENLKYVEEMKKIFDEFGISYETKILSGMDTLKPVYEFVEYAENNKIEIIIVLAGISTHLPGIIASKTLIPVIGVPLPSKDIANTDIIFSMIQMPEGVPVACVSYGKAGIINSVLLALEILSLKEEKIKEKLKEFKVKFV
jgi:5-(carboxyamino)imidazole ribonucleotide mutase